MQIKKTLILSILSVTATSTTSAWAETVLSASIGYPSADLYAEAGDPTALLKKPSIDLENEAGIGDFLALDARFGALELSLVRLDTEFDQAKIDTDFFTDEIGLATEGKASLEGSGFIIAYSINTPTRLLAIHGGLGLGALRTKLNYQSSDGSRQNTDTNWATAIQGKLGGSFPILPTIRLYAGWRYIWMPSVEYEIEEITVDAMIDTNIFEIALQFPL